MSTIIPKNRLGSQTSWYHRAVGLLALAAMLALLIVLGVRGAEYLTYAARALVFPFGLDYAEGIIWQQLLLIPGPRMYAGITQPPFIVFHYSPVYHLLVRTIGATGIDPLAAGRGISLAATIVIAVVAGSITFTAMNESFSTAGRIFGSLLAGMMVLSYHPVQYSAVLMRPDMLAIAFSFTGVYIAIVAGARTYILCLAVVFFSLAVYTKQTELSAPIAALAVAAIISLRSALKAAAFGLMISGTALIVLLLATDGGFWRHIVEYNLHNPFTFKNMIYLLVRQKRDTLGLLAGVMALVFLWWKEAIAYPARDLRGWVAAIRQSKRLRVLSIVSLWFVLASLQLVEVGKSGAWDNYFVEWMCITAVPIGMAAMIAWAGSATGGKAAVSSGLAGLFLSLILATHTLHRSPFEFSIVDDPQARALRAHLVDLIRENRKPVLIDDMVLLLRAGHQVFIEPAIFTQLANAGYWDQAPLLKLIQDHGFGLIITQAPTMKVAIADDLFTNELAHAIENSYPSVQHIGDYVVRRPSAP